MTNFSDSLLLTAQAKWTERFAKNDMRKPLTPFMDVFGKYANILIPQLETIKTSDQRAIEAYHFKRLAAPVSNARGCTHTDCCSDSGKTALTWKTYSANVCASEKRGDRNVFKTPEMFANDMENKIMDIYAAIEADLYAYCVANANAANAATNPRLGSLQTGIWRVPVADRLLYFSRLMYMMKANRYTWGLDSINDMGLASEVASQVPQGSNNALNLVPQFGMFSMYDSSDILTTAGYFGNNFVIPQGTVAMLNWIPRLNREGKQSLQAGKWTSMPSPYGDGLEFAVHITDACADTSQTNGETQDLVTYYEISVDICTTHAPAANANDTPIFHCGLFAT